MTSVEWYGTVGTPVDVTVNFIQIEINRKLVYEYEVRYEPEQDDEDLRFHLLHEHEQYFTNVIYDGIALYSPNPLPRNACNLVSFNPYDHSTVNIELKLKGLTMTMRDVKAFYNVLFESIMRNNLYWVRLGDRHFNYHEATIIPKANLEVWNGYKTAVDKYEGGWMLTLDTAHRVFSTYTMMNLIQEAVGLQGVNWKEFVSESLTGCSAMTTYNMKQYIEIRQMALSYVPGSIEWIVPDLCGLMGRKLQEEDNSTLRKEVTAYTMSTPNGRLNACNQYISSVIQNQTACNRLKGWGLRLASETINITARTLPPERLYFGDKVKIDGKPDAEWNNEVTENLVVTAVNIIHWILICAEEDSVYIEKFLDILISNSWQMGIKIEKPEIIIIMNKKIDSYITALKQSIMPNTQLVVVICPKRKTCLVAITKICCVDLPVPFQVIDRRDMKDEMRFHTMMRTMLLQLNCKVGSVLWHVNIPFKSAMVIGIYVYHDEMKKNNVFAMVASYNPSITKWSSSVVFLKKDEDITRCQNSCFVNALTYFKNINERFPDKIIVYREGVENDQFKTIRDHEIPQIKHRISEVHSNYVPMITYIVVQKRVVTRIFQQDAGIYNNPSPGTVIDNKITKTDWHNFFLASQKVEKGVATPTQYVVVHDDIKMQPDHCQRLTYKLCHLSFPSCHTLKTPAPCNYALKLALFVGQDLKRKPSVVLTDKLFFL